MKTTKSYKDKLKNVDERYYYTDITGTALVHKKDLALILDVTVRSIENYEKQGLRRWENSPQRTPMYLLVDSINWYVNNISNKSSGIDSDNKPNEAYMEFLNNLTPLERELFQSSNLDPIDKLSRMKDIERKSMKNEIEKGNWVNKDDLDKNMTTLAALLMTALIQYEDLAPSQLENKSKEEISEIIYDVHSNVFDELDTLINKEFDCDESFYEVMLICSPSNGTVPPSGYIFAIGVPLLFSSTEIIAINIPDFKLIAIKH